MKPREKNLKMPVKELAERYDIPEDAAGPLIRTVVNEVVARMAENAPTTQIIPVPPKPLDYTKKELEQLERNLAEALGDCVTEDYCQTIMNWAQKNITIPTISERLKRNWKLRADIVADIGKIVNATRKAELQERRVAALEKIAEARMIDVLSKEDFRSFQKTQSKLADRIAKLEASLRERSTKKD